eukprot:gene16500-22726_t
MSSVIFVMGAPGAGKGTQSQRIVERFGWKHLSTGDLLRSEVAAATELGNQAAEIMQRGQMVPTTMVLGLISQAMATSGGHRFLVDGFPRTLDQLQEFESQIQPCDGVLVFHVPEDVAVARLLERSASSGRADGDEATIHKRMAVFNGESQPVIEALRESGRVVEISADASPDEVFQSVVPFLEQMELQAASKRASLRTPPFGSLKEKQASTPGAPCKARAMTPEERVALALEYDEGQIRAVITIQAAGRGMIERRRTASMRGSVAGTPSGTAGSAQASVQMTPPGSAGVARAMTPEERVALALEYDEDRIRAVITIQAAGRGMLDRRRTASMRGSVAGTPPGTAGGAPDSKQMTPPSSAGVASKHRAAVAEALTSSISSLLVICGPSGVGKGTLINKLIQEYSTRFAFSVSHTTRGPRPGEENGTHYHFADREEMQAEIDADLFLEHARVHGNLYGTSLRAVADVSATGKITVLDIDVQGATSVKQSLCKEKATFIFVSPPSLKALEARLRGRQTETEDKIQMRMANARSEMEKGSEPGFFHVNITNDDLDRAYHELKMHIHAHIPGTFTDKELRPPTAQEPSRPQPPLADPCPTSVGGKPEPSPPSVHNVGLGPPAVHSVGLGSPDASVIITDASVNTKDAATIKMIKTLPVRQYMDQQVVPILREALRALNENRPADPFLFLSDFMLEGSCQEAADDFVLEALKRTAAVSGNY